MESTNALKTEDIVARPRKNPTGPQQLTSGQATYVLDRLIRERRISQSDVSRYVGDMRQEISELEQRLHSLREAAGHVVEKVVAAVRRGRPPGSGNKKKPGRGPGRPPGRPAKRRGRPPASAAASGASAGAASGASATAAPAKRGRGRKGGAKRSSANLTPEQRASRQLQGKYLALIRQIPAAKRGQYAKTAKEKGREAAIKDMQEAVGK